MSSGAQRDMSAAPSAFDRAAALRRAEKMLRIGQLEPAIEQYEQVVRHSPDDFATAASLGHLYLRAGATTKAVEHFIAVAGSLKARGLGAQAAAAYSRVLTLDDGNEEALLNLADIASSLHNVADARTHLTALERRRRARGDHHGAAEIIIRVAALDPQDFTARLAGACARQELGDVDGAVADLRGAADDLLTAGRHSEAAEMLKEATVLAPHDQSLRDRLFDAHLLANNFAAAKEAACTATHWKRLATILLAVDEESALDVLREAASRQPGDLGLQASLARWFVARGDAAGAAAYLHPDMAEEDPAVVLTIAEIQLRGGREDDALALIERCVAAAPECVGEVSELGMRALDALPATAWRLVSLAVDVWIEYGELPKASAALEAFVSRMPESTTALVRLVEVAIDAGLPDVASRVQGQLADAYLKTGAAAQALVIIEDLVTRERDKPEHIERLRRALLALGEADVENAIARRLNATISFSDDVAGR